MPAVNQRISEYLLEEKVGAGAFGEVWRARHHVWSDQHVAVKIPTDPQYILNLQREGAAIHGLVHANIVRALGFDPYADPPYLVMEYVPGTSLRPLITNRQLKIPDAVNVMRQILAGLSHAHKNNLIHRDIKPENILIDQRLAADGYKTTGAVKITDFGLGLAAKPTAESIALSASMSQDEARKIAGTLDYMSPEQRNGNDVDARSDLYACGIILHELLVGDRPAGTDVPSDINSAIPTYLDEAFRRSYARLDKRFASADEFLAFLQKATAPPPLMPQFAPPIAPPLPMNLGIRSAPPLPHEVPPLSTGPELLRSCPNCRKNVSAADQFCIHCGIQLVPQVRRCRNCGAFPDPVDHFCIFCGQSLAASVG